MRGSAAFRAAVAPGGVLAGPWVKNELWRRARAVPSLDLRFAESKSLVDSVSGQNLITFTRASTGTFVDSDGVIRSATTNLLLRSEEFDNAPWVLVSGSVSTNTETSPTGVLTADKLVAAVSPGTSGQIAQGVTISSGATITASVFAKEAGFNRIGLTLLAGNNTTPYGSATFNVQTGQIDIAASTGNGGTNVSASIEPYLNGWYRCRLTVTYPATTSAGLRLLTTNADGAAGDGTKGVYLWGAQLEQSSTVGPYIPTTSTINSAPRFDHNPLTGECLGLLPEEQRSNGYTNSENISGLAGVAVAVAASAQTTPSNNTNAVSVTEDGTNDQHYATLNVPTTSGTPVCVSIFARLGSGTRNLTIRGLAGNFGSVTDARFDLTTGTASLTAASIQAYRNGWYRCTFTATPTTTGTTGLRLHLSSGTTITYQGDGTSSILLYGPQAENGAFPTSYIPTTGTAATRTADVVSCSGTNFSSWYRQDEGTVFVNASNQPFGSAVFAISNNTVGNRIQISSGTNNRTARIVTGGSTQALESLSYTYAALQPAAVSYAADLMRFANAGALANEDTVASMPIVDRLYIGSDFSGSNPANGHISRLTYWPTRLPNSTLQSITQ